MVENDSKVQIKAIDWRIAIPCPYVTHYDANAGHDIKPVLCTKAKKLHGYCHRCGWNPEVAADRLAHAPRRKVTSIVYDVRPDNPDEKGEIHSVSHNSWALIVKTRSNGKVKLSQAPFSGGMACTRIPWQRQRIESQRLRHGIVSHATAMIAFYK